MHSNTLAWRVTRGSGFQYLATCWGVRQLLFLQLGMRAKLPHCHSPQLLPRLLPPLRCLLLSMAENTLLVIHHNASSLCHKSSYITAAKMS